MFKGTRLLIYELRALLGLVYEPQPPNLPEGPPEKALHIPTITTAKTAKQNTPHVAALRKYGIR